MMLSADPELHRHVALRVVERNLLRLKWHAAATRFELSLRRHDRALKHAFKAGFNPDQPRVPAGNPDGGQWTGDGGSARTRLAGDIPTGDAPEIPKEPPPTTKLRNALIRGLARKLGPYIWVAAEAGSWIYDHKDEISSYFDAPKSLEKLQDAVSSPEKGYDVHHVVERNSASADGSEDDRIDAPENLVRIPRWKHWELNAWYETADKDYGGLTPRQYLRGKSWEERMRVGLEGLRKVGVLRQ